jgi:hypothetical protein
MSDNREKIWFWAGEILTLSWIVDYPRVTPAYRQISSLIVWLGNITCGNDKHREK